MIFGGNPIKSSVRFAFQQGHIEYSGPTLQRFQSAPVTRIDGRVVVAAKERRHADPPLERSILCEIG